MHHNQIQQLYEAHGAHIALRCQRILGDEEEAYDVCHDVFVRLVEAKRAPKVGECLPWLYRVATNACIDVLRKHKRSPLSVSWEEVVEGHDALASSFGESDMFRRAQIEQLWPQLLEEEQMLLILRYIDELSLEELEEVCGLTRKTISKRLKKLGEKARELLAPTHLAE